MNYYSIQGRGGGVAILLVAPCYRGKPDITTVLMGCLTRMQTLLCKIVICLEIPHLQWRQSFYLNNNGGGSKGGARRAPPPLLFWKKRREKAGQNRPLSLAQGLDPPLNK